MNMKILIGNRGDSEFRIRLLNGSMSWTLDPGKTIIVHGEVSIVGLNANPFDKDAAEIERLTAENERLLAALEGICKVQNTYRSREQELAAMCLNQQSESNGD